LAAHRSAVIVNSLLGRRVYATEVEPTPVQWSSAQSEPALRPPIARARWRDSSS
jgi:hypothetical protein